MSISDKKTIIKHFKFLCFFLWIINEDLKFFSGSYFICDAIRGAVFSLSKMAKALCRQWFVWKFCLILLVFVLDVSAEQSTRRSKRTIVPPLQYWKNERIDYERWKSGRVDGNDFYPSLPSTLFFLSSFLTFSSHFYFNFASGGNDSLVPTVSQVSKFVTITVLPPHYSWLRSRQKTQLHACVV